MSHMPARTSPHPTWNGARRKGTMGCDVLRDGTLAGLLLGACTRIQRHIDRQLRPRAVRVLPMRRGLLIRRTIWTRMRSLVCCDYRERKPMAGCRDSGPDERFKLLVVGVRSNFHDLGVGDLLMRTFREKCASRGIVSAELCVDATNSPSHRLYEKHGWMMSNEGGGVKRYDIGFWKAD